jgi:hypothetical protein
MILDSFFKIKLGYHTRKRIIKKGLPRTFLNVFLFFAFGFEAKKEVLVMKKKEV